MCRYTYPLILIILSCSIFSACDDAEETPDTEAPEITVKSPNENQHVSGTITIEATAEDRDNELSMQLFLDGNLLGESSGGAISAQSDTKTLTEGIHTIKITATDMTGNASEKTFDVDVRNILLKVHVSSNYVPEYAQIYFALSQNDGSLLAVNQVENGSIVTVPTPSNFNPDSSFVLTQYFYLFQPASDISIAYLIKSMNVYAGLNAGEFSLPEYEHWVPIVGTHQVEVTELPTDNHLGHLQGRNTGSIYGNFGNDGKFTAELGMRSNTSDLYFSLTAGTAVPVYNYISSIHAGGSTHFSVTGLPEMQKAEVATRDIAGSYECHVYSDDASFSVNFSSANGFFDDGKIPIYYPSTIYPQYVFSLRYQLGNSTYENRVRGATPPASFQYLNAAASNVNYANKKLKVTSTGSFDVMTISGGSSNYDGNSQSLDLYYVSFPNGTRNQITIPNTPAELSSLEFKSPDDFSFNSAGFYDYLGLSGTNDYQSKIIFSADNVLRQNRDHISDFLQITTTSAGGRVSSHKKMTLPKRLETILQNHFPVVEFEVSH